MIDVDEILTLLEAWANAEHDDFSVVDEAVHEIKALFGANNGLRSENGLLLTLEQRVRDLYSAADEWDCDGLGLHAPFYSWHPVVDALEAIDAARGVNDE